MALFLSKLQWPSVVLLITIICAIVVCAALGVSNEAIAIVGAVGAVLQAFAPALGKRDTDVLPLVLLAAAVPFLVSGCGAAGTVSTSAACSTLLVTIGERRDYAPERAHADIDAVAEVCSRLAVSDGGTQ